MTAAVRRTMSGDEHTVVRRISLEADAWGGTFTPAASAARTSNGLQPLGRLRLPTQAGLRYGWTEGELSRQLSQDAGDRQADSDSATVELVFETEISELRVQRAAVAVLMLSAAGALTVIFAPLVPVLFSLLPVGVMLSLAGWLFVVARLRNSGPEEFFAAIATADPAENSPTLE